MISLEECEKLIPNDKNLTEEEIFLIRDDLYETARIALESYFKERE